MRCKENSPPRVYKISGLASNISIKDCASIELDDNEQVTFVTSCGKEYDVTRKEWGFYATPSINARLRSFSFRSALVVNSIGRLFLMLVEDDKEDLFYKYLNEDSQKLICWLEDAESIKKIISCFSE